MKNRNSTDTTAAQIVITASPASITVQRTEPIFEITSIMTSYLFYLYILLEIIIRRGVDNIMEDSNKEAHQYQRKDKIHHSFARNAFNAIQAVLPVFISRNMFPAA